MTPGGAPCAGGWAPSGRELACDGDGRLLVLDRAPRSSGESGPHALFVTPSSGGQPRRITPWGYSDDQASWSPDGRTIVFGTFGSLYRVSPSGKGLAKIAVETPDGLPLSNVFDVSFSPDGKRIVFSLASAEPGIYLARADGSGAERLTASPSWGAAAG